VKKSLIDRLVDAIERSPLPWWALGAIAWVIHSTVQAAVLWITGTADLGSYPWFTLSEPFFLVVPILGYLYLSRFAIRSFDRFRPALEMDEATADTYRRRLSTTPSHMFWVWLFVGGVPGGLAILFGTGYYEEYLVAPVGTASWMFFGFISFGVNIVVGALIIRQVRLVARLHRDAKHVDLFRPEPLHAFASLTARTGAFVLLNLMYSTITDPSTFTNPVWRMVFFVASGLAAAVFYFPLQGLAIRLREEKRAMLDRSSVRISAITDELNQAVDARDLGRVGDLRAGLTALGEVHERIRKVSPWPWDTGTIRGFATTLVIPLTTWFLTNLLNRALF
jgi:hypothetical protein